MFLIRLLFSLGSIERTAGEGGLVAFRELLFTTGSPECRSARDEGRAQAHLSVVFQGMEGAVQGWAGTQTLPATYVWW